MSQTKISEPVTLESVSASVESVSASVESVSASVESVSASVDSLSTNVGALSMNIKTIAESISKLPTYEYIDNAVSKLATKDELNEVKSIVKDLPTKADLENSFDELARMTAVGFNEMDSRFVKIDERFEQVDERFNQMDIRFDTLEGRFDRLENRFDGLEETVINKHGRRLSKLESKLQVA